MPVTYTFSSGGTITAAELNTNFSDVLSEISSISSADIAANAGILSTQLSDRFAIFSESIPIVGHPYDDGALTSRLYYWPDTTTPEEIYRKYMTLPTGRACYLCGISVYAQSIITPGAQRPCITFTRNGTTIGGTHAQFDAADTVYHLRNSNPLDNPLTALANNDYISMGIHLQNSGSTATGAGGVMATLTYKVELHS